MKPSTARSASKSDAPRFAGIDDSDGTPGSEYTPVFAIAAFAAGYFEQLTINVPFLIKVFAWYTLLKAAATIIFVDTDLDKVGTVIAPAVLAARVAVSQFQTIDVVIAVFGYYLARELKGLPFWGWIGTLLAAIYFDYGLIWIIGAYAFGSVTRLADSLENQNKLPATTVPVLAASIFAVVKEYKCLWVVSLALGEVARSFYNLARNVKGKEPKGLRLN